MTPAHRRDEPSQSCYPLHALNAAGTRYVDTFELDLTNGPQPANILVGNMRRVIAAFSGKVNPCPSPFGRRLQRVRSTFSDSQDLRPHVGKMSNDKRCVDLLQVW